LLISVRTNGRATAGGTTSSYFLPAGCRYWKHSMPDSRSVYVTGPTDLNNDTSITLPTGCNFDAANNPMGYYATGLFAYVEMPTLGVDASNNLYLCYQAVDELSDTTLYGEDFMHPYLIKSVNGGMTWSNPDQAIDVVLVTKPGCT